MYRYPPDCVSSVLLDLGLRSELFWCPNALHFFSSPPSCHFSFRPPTRQTVFPPTGTPASCLRWFHIAKPRSYLQRPSAGPKLSLNISHWRKCIWRVKEYRDFLGGSVKARHLRAVGSELSFTAWMAALDESCVQINASVSSRLHIFLCLSRLAWNCS